MHVLNFRETYRISDEYTRVALASLFILVGGGLLASIFLSATLVLGSLLAIITVWVTFFRPRWSLGFLLLYLPFEPFLLKWVPDDLYLYARYFSECLVYLLVISTIWKIITGKISWRGTNADLPFILLVIFALASAVVNLVPAWTAILGLRQIIRFMLLFFVTVYLRPSLSWMKAMAVGLALVVAVQISIGLAQAVVGEPLDNFLLPSEARNFGEIQLTAGTIQFWDPGSRIFATMGRYDQLGTWLALMMLLLLALLYEPRLKRFHLAAGAIFLVSIPALVLTYSRSSWFGFLLGFLFITIIAKRDKRVMLGAGLSAAAIVLYLAFSGLVVGRLVEGADQTITERFFEAFSYERWRGEYYGLGRLFWIVQTVLTVIPASPIFGHGPGTYGAGAVAALGNTQVYDELGLPFGVYGTEGYIDNNWMSLWGELGSVGLIIYLWFYLGIAWACWRAYLGSKKSITRALALAAAAGFLAVALNAFLATFLEVRTLAAYLWVLAGLVYVRAEQEKLLKDD